MVELQSCEMRIEQATPILTHTPSWYGTTDRIVVSTDAAYDVLVLDRGGQTRRVRRALESMVATREHALEELRGATLIEGLDCDPREIVEQFGVAPFIPAIRRLAIAPDGNLWVQRKVGGDAPGPTDLFDSSGEYVGTLDSTFPFPAAFFPDGRIIATETDPLGVARVVVYAIETQGSA